MNGETQTDVESMPSPRHIGARVGNEGGGPLLVSNLVLLRAYGVEDEILDLVVEMALAQNLDEETTAAINYLASGFLLALLALREEGIFRSFHAGKDR